ncbi:MULTISPECIES: CAP domain-containing protein [Cytobacillus]|uniref:CAP domain-containing protein n=1 Tax=Cytobacillus TaxID=2675230 RepID=UPI00203DB761|nr:CAP domain-containing protein [Cytobacillus firmus]MCM3708685.1 CAP domain-containing protein [Cytobacillus firmus]
MICIFLAAGFYIDIGRKEKGEILVSQENTIKDMDNKENNLSSNTGFPEKGVISLMGKSVEALKKSLGEPSRVDPSFYGYEWWIYNKSGTEYIQAGVSNNKVVSLFTTGEDSDISPFRIGQPIGELYSSVFFETEFSLKVKDSSYRFELSEDDLNTRPLVMVGEYYAQLNIDRFTGTLSSVRLMDAATLIKIRPYEMVYRGELLVPPLPSPAFEDDVERAKEKQIFEITNVIRVSHHLQPLKWDDQTAVAALAHSKDMYETKDFSHTSKTYGDLADRLEAADVSYEAAGENIAANYTDAPAVVEGWLNSKGHRDSLLKEEFTHLGVGVYKKHYTQNFIKKAVGEAEN